MEKEEKYMPGYGKYSKISNTVFHTVYTHPLPKPPMGRGDILFLVQILLASVSALAPHFFVCTVSSEPEVGFEPNFHGHKLGHNKELILETLY